MIKRKSKAQRLIGMLVVFILLMLFTLNVTYSYFTATASVNGSMNFSNFEVEVGYAKGTTEFTSIIENPISVTPNTTIIDRGNSFGLQFNAEDIRYLYFSPTSTSCSCYIRFMLNAYKVNEDDSIDESVNYGRYFQVNYSSGGITRSLKTTNGTDTNAVYYMTNVLESNKIYGFCDSITLLEDAPLSMLNSNIKLTITYKAVQSANEAFKEVFNDGWGYLNSWT